MLVLPLPRAVRQTALFHASPWAAGDLITCTLPAAASHLCNPEVLMIALLRPRLNRKASPFELIGVSVRDAHDAPHLTTAAEVQHRDAFGHLCDFRWVPAPHQSHGLYFLIYCNCKLYFPSLMVGYEGGVRVGIGVCIGAPAKYRRSQDTAKRGAWNVWENITYTG